MDNLGYRNWGNTSSSYNDSMDSPVDKYFNKKYDNSSKNKNKQQQQPQQQSILTDSYDYDTSNDFIESPVAVASKKDHRNMYNTTATSSYRRSNNNTDYGNNKNSTDTSGGSRYGASTRRVSVDDRAREILERSKQVKLGDSYEDDKSRLKSYEDTLAEFRLGGYIPTESIVQHDDDDDDGGGGVESNGKDVKRRLTTYSTASSPDNHHYRRPEDSPLESPFGITDSFEISASDFEVGAIAAKIQERKSKDKLNDRRQRRSFDYSKGDESHDYNSDNNNNLSVSSSIHHHLKETSSPDISRTAVIGRRNSNNSSTLLIDDRYDANNSNNNNNKNLIHNNNNKMQFSTALSSIHKNNTIDNDDDNNDRALHDYNGVRRFGSAERSDDEIYKMLNVTTGTQDSMKFGMNNETSNTLDSNILTETALSAVGGKTKKRSDSQRHPSLGEISDVTQRSSSPTMNNHQNDGIINVATGHHHLGGVVGKSDDKYKFNRYGDNDDDDDDDDDDDAYENEHDHDVINKMKKNKSAQYLNDDNDDKNNEDEDDKYSGDSNHAYSPPINHHDKNNHHEDDDHDDEDEYSLDGFETNSPDGKNNVATTTTTTIILSTTKRNHHRDDDDDVNDNQQQQQQQPIDPFDEIRQRWYNAESSDFLQRLTSRVDNNDNIDDNNNDISFQIQNKTGADSSEKRKDVDLKIFNNNDHNDSKHHDNSPSNHSSEAGTKQSNHHTSLTLAKDDDDDENDSTLPNSIISNTSKQMKNSEGMLYCTYRIGRYMDECIYLCIYLFIIYLSYTLIYFTICTIKVSFSPILMSHLM